MSTSSQESNDPTGSEEDAGIGIGDDRLPEDLVPGEDNPLAESPEDGEGVGDLLEDGKEGERTEADGPGGTGSTEGAARPDGGSDGDSDDDSDDDRD